MFSYYSVIVYLLVGAAAVLALIDGILHVRRQRTPVAIAVLVLAAVLLLSLVTLPAHGLAMLVVAAAAMLTIALIVEFVTDRGKRQPLTIVAAIVTLLGLVSLWPLTGSLLT